MAQYRIFYEFLEKPEEFQEKTDSAFVKAETPWGQGTIDGELEYIPETRLEWQNLSREIAQHRNYHTVNVTRILPLSLQGQVLQGEVIADES